MRNLLLISLQVLLALPASAASDAAYAEALADFRQTPEVAAMLDEAYGYALFPTVGKGAFGIGGAYGEGRVYVGGRHVGNTSLTQVSFGFQLGGQAFSQIILFRNKDAFDEFSTGKFSFGAEASAIALTAGAQARANSMGSSASASDAKPGGAAVGAWNGSMATFVLAKGGLMYESSIGGQSFSFTPVAAEAG